MRQILALFFFILFLCGAASAATVTLAWDDPDNDSAQILGYRVYYGKTSQSGVSDPDDLVSASPYDQRVELANPSLRQWTTPVLGVGVWYFRIVAYGMINGVVDDGPFSNEVFDKIGFAKVTITSTTVTYP